MFVSAKNSQSMIANNSSITVMSPQECDIGDVRACEDFPTIDDDVCSLPTREGEDHQADAQDSPIGVDGSFEVE
jgi:hypothetical protein